MSEHDLILTRRMAVSPERIYRAWTEPELLKHWFTPKPVVTKEAIVELRPGGRFYSLMVMPDGTEYPNEGCILVAETNRRLVFTECLTAGFRPADKPMLMMSAEILLTPDGDGTIYQARAMHGNAETMKQHEEMGFHDGWGTAATQLEEFCKTM